MFADSADKWIKYPSRCLAYKTQPPLEFQDQPGSYLLLQAADVVLILGVILLTARISLLMPLEDATFEFRVGLLQGAHLVQELSVTAPSLIQLRKRSQSVAGAGQADSTPAGLIKGADGGGGAGANAAAVVGNTASHGLGNL